MIYAIVAAVCAAGLGAIIALAKHLGRQKAEDESLQKTNATQAGQMAIAARPPASPDALLERMSSNDL